MKAILLTLILFSSRAFAQQMDDMPSSSAANGPQIYGYVDGIRLDSIDAVYAEFTRHNVNGLHFDYGQRWVKRKDFIVTDSEGRRLVFNRATTPLFLNFFHFNGWQLDKAVANRDGKAGTFILKKIP